MSGNKQEQDIALFAAVLMEMGEYPNTPDDNKRSIWHLRAYQKIRYSFLGDADQETVTRAWQQFVKWADLPILYTRVNRERINKQIMEGIRSELVSDNKHERQ